MLISNCCGVREHETNPVYQHCHEGTGICPKCHEHCVFEEYQPDGEIMTNSCGESSWVPYRRPFILDQIRKAKYDYETTRPSGFPATHLLLGNDKYAELCGHVMVLERKDTPVQLWKYLNLEILIVADKDFVGVAGALVLPAEVLNLDTILSHFQE